MENTTAIQDILIWITEIENSPASLTFSETDFRTLSQFKEKIASKLEKEKRQITEAFDHAEIMTGAFFQTFDNGEEYYKNKFK